jgi:hypothetical protein
MLRNLVSKRNVISIALVLVALAAVSLALKPRAAQADEQSGELHVTKDCSMDTNDAGFYCTIVTSNLAELVGARVFYTQAAVGCDTGATSYPCPPTPPATPEGGVIPYDANAVLYVGTGEWAVGRCTLDLNSNGLCTFSDGTGKFRGFHGRVDVSYTPTAAYPFLFTWNGTYSFTSGSN